MRKIAYVEYRLNIAGLYAMGPGWLKREYAVRFHSLCDQLHVQHTHDDPRQKDDIFVFTNSVYQSDTSFCSPMFASSNFDAYMHGMEVVGHYASSKYCPNDHLRATDYVKTFLEKLAKRIREEFSDVQNLALDYRIETHYIDLDSPNQGIRGIL